jgi:hypothetical protein
MIRGAEYGEGTLSEGARSLVIPNGNGLERHVLESVGAPTAGGFRASL